MKRVAILGATRGMGRALARRFVERGDFVAVLGRGADEVRRSVADLEARGVPGTRVAGFTCDLELPETFKPALEAAEQRLDGLDTVVVTAGAFATQEQLERDPALAARVLTVDFANTVLFCEEAKKKLLQRGGGTLCVFSSVAGDRGRSPVVLYGAAKAGLSAYLEGLDHKHRKDGLVTVCVKPGFVRTAMTEGLPTPPFAGDPEAVAGVVLEGLDAGTPVVYAPPVWRAVMTAIKAMPRFVMRRVKF
ncbi:MAG: SDR family NAD(P)-dependent oxidoreductase [Myxococcaceae bacterium]|nr:SDR family NAD(P)-dependent oxidoreductase [Myxococcaceae bacterium]MCA3011941.1 SDR family NAD(P)-dependent oxidoreductase [Myxococcaceae bacterium]